MVPTDGPLGLGWSMDEQETVAHSNAGRFDGMRVGVANVSEDAGSESGEEHEVETVKIWGDEGRTWRLVNWAVM